MKDSQKKVKREGNIKIFLHFFMFFFTPNLVHHKMINDQNISCYNLIKLKYKLVFSQMELI